MIDLLKVLRVSIPFLHHEKVPAVVTVSMSVGQLQSLISSLQKAFDDGEIDKLVEQPPTMPRNSGKRYDPNGDR